LYFSDTQYQTDGHIKFKQQSKCIAILVPSPEAVITANHQ
jgi:hypothetical protein